MKALRPCLIILLSLLAFLPASCRPVADIPREESWRPPPSSRPVGEAAELLDDLDIKTLEKAVNLSIGYYERNGRRNLTVFRIPAALPPR